MQFRQRRKVTSEKGLKVRCLKYRADKGVRISVVGVDSTHQLGYLLANVFVPPKKSFFIIFVYVLGEVRFIRFCHDNPL